MLDDDDLIVVLLHGYLGGALVMCMTAARDVWGSFPEILPLRNILATTEVYSESGSWWCDSTVPRRARKLSDLRLIPLRACLIVVSSNFGNEATESAPVFAFTLVLSTIML